MHRGQSDDCALHLVDAVVSTLLIAAPDGCFEAWFKRVSGFGGFGGFGWFGGFGCAPRLIALTVRRACLCAALLDESAPAPG